MGIREVRRRRKMTQKDLADRLGVDTSVVSKYELGKVKLSIDRLKQIAVVLEVDPSELMEEMTTIPSEGEIERLRLLNRRIYANPNERYLKALVKYAANGYCELCKEKAPFLDKAGLPYLEVFRLEETYSGDCPEKNYVALCPNCFQKIKINPTENDRENLKEIAEKHDLTNVV